MSGDSLPLSPAAERNKQPILEVLQTLLRPGARVLEIGAGTGQHAVYFARELPEILWQATELAEHLPLLAERIRLEAPNLPAPLALDVSDAAQWPAGPFDAIYTANTLHIMPWENTAVLIEQSVQRLASGGHLVVYGPFHDADRHTAESNRRFDHDLRSRSPHMGVRDAVQITRLAEHQGLRGRDDIAMPANNRILVFEKGEV